MSNSPRMDHLGTVHHVAARGLEKRRIFIDDEDRTMFVGLLRTTFARAGARCVAWSLMSNHYHLSPQTGEKRLSWIMHRVNAVYASYFNRRHDRVGPLFQGRYWSRPIGGPGDLLAVMSYIHANPVAAGVVDCVDALAEYPWTGYAALVSGRPDGVIDLPAAQYLCGLDREEDPAGRLLTSLGEAVADGDDHVRFAPFSGERPVLTRHDSASPDIWNRCANGSAIDAIREREADRRRRQRMCRLAGWNVARITALICERHGVSYEAVSSGRRGARWASARRGAACVATELIGASRAEIARVLGVSAQAVSKALLMTAESLDCRQFEHQLQPFWPPRV